MDEVATGISRLLADVLQPGGGLDSITAARLVVEIESAYAVEMPMEWLLEWRDTGELAQRIAALVAGREGGVALRSRPEPEADLGRAHEPFPLTPLQQAYVVGRDIVPDPAGCHVYRELALADPDVARLRAAWQRVIDHHDMLRAVLTADGRQRVQERAPAWTLPVHDLRDEAPAAFAAHVEAVRARMSHRLYEIGEWPLFAIEVSLGPAGAVVHFSIDLILTDGHGLGLLLDHWWRCYERPDVELPAAPVTVRDCVTALAARRAAPGYRAELDYWAGRLDGMPPGPDLLAAPAPPLAAGCFERRPRTGSLPAPRWRAVRDLAAAWNVSPTALVLTAFSEALARAGAAQPFSLLLTTSTRLRLPAGVDLLAGPFTSTVVLVVEASRDRTLEEAARAIQRRLWEDLDHAAVSGVEAMRELRLRGTAPEQPALAVVFTSMLDADVGGGFAGRTSYAVSQTCGVALDHQMWEEDGELRYRWDVTDAIFVPSTVDALFADFANGLEALATDAGGAAARPLDDLQQAYLVQRLVAGEGCQVTGSWRAHDLDVGRLESAWLRMLAAHEALRSLLTSDGRVLVRPDAPAAWRIPVLDIDRDDAGRPFALDRWPQFDLRVVRDTVQLTVDLAIADCRSTHLLLRELARLYADEAAAPAPAAPIGEPPAPDPAQRAHWRERLTGLPAGPPIAPAGEDRRRTRRTCRVERWPRLKEWARGRGLTPDAVLLAAFAGALAERYDAPFALPVVRWARSEERFRPGERTRLSWARAEPGETLAARAERYEREIAADERADAVSGLAELRRLGRGASTAHPVVYTGILDLADVPLPAGVEHGPWLTWTPGVSLDCVAIDEGGALECGWDAVEADFPPGLLDELFDRFQALLDGLPQEPPVHRLFEEHARERPAAVAVRWHGGAMTYGDLDRLANRVAWRLRELGVGPEAAVGIATRRGPEMVAAVLGVLKAGGAYLPVEPGLPAERAAAMLADTGASVLLTTAGEPAWAVPAGVRVVAVDPAGEPDPREASSPDPGTTPANTAYVIFTSGSTGRPKGVAVTHRAARHLIDWCARTFRFGPDDVGLCVTSLGFDLSVFDVLGLLGLGAGLYVAGEAERRDPQLLLDVLLREPVTFWNSAPTTLNQLAPLLVAVRGGPGTDALRLVFLSGDYTPLALPDEVRAVFPNARVVSLGGATEATVWSNWFPVETIDPDWRSIPYGRPIDGASYHVCDGDLAPCPVGVEGDLYIAGTVLSAGYWNRAALTAERFLPDPFAAGPGERMYRTGDRAALLPDGNLTFLGRADGQVKIRGFRVELGEVEHRLRRHAGVKDAVVLARPDPAGDRRLVAYVVPAARPGPQARELRAFAAEALPDYMVPSVVALVDAFPATANGKLDRQALPWPLPGSGNGHAAGPELATEVAALFARFLDVPAVDADADLWEQGATSFTMVQVSRELQQRHGLRLPVEALVAEPTAAGIARSVAAALPGAPAEPRVDFFSPEARAEFKAAEPALRPAAGRLLPLDDLPPAAEHYGWRATVRDFLAGPVPRASFGRLLGLLRRATIEGRERHLYPSAGDTFAVQVYLHVRPDGVDGVPEGLYYYQPREHALQAVAETPGLDRSVHFFYNRPVFDRAAFEVYLVGQTRGIEPLYGADAERFLTLEAGYMGQLLMMGQAACGIGLCPIGSLAFDRVSGRLGLDEGHRFLQAFLGGAAPAAERSVFAALPAPDAPAPPATAAVVGMAGRYPGAGGLDAFWANLAAGRRSIGALPARRAEAWGGRAPLGGYLDDIERFDSLLFHVSPAEARTLDPQLRLLLPVVWECLENAGHTAASLRRAAGRVGVFAGVMWHDFQQVGADEWRGRPGARVEAAASDIPNRISHFFDFEGPSLAVDTSCSSSLTALHLAVESLRQGECGAAVVAAVNLVAHPYHLGLLASLGLIAPDGTAGAFDGAASGWTPGEGAGAVLLRPVGVAEAEGDVLHGVIEATWVGHAGHGGRYGAPSAPALATSIAGALERACVRPDGVDYVELAAAGASVADAAELEALGRVFAGRAPLAGTLKPNIGHLESASGMSQLAKVLLQLGRGQIAPTLLAPRRNPLVAWDDPPVRLVDRLTPGAPRRTLVNALGASGSYAHVVVRSRKAD